MEDKFIKVDNVSKSYGKNNALDDVSFEIKKGEVVGLLGQNGSGKSTLLDILALANKKDSGKIFLDGLDYDSSPKVLRPKIGFAPQEIALFQELTVKENLICWSNLRRKEAVARAKEISREINIEDFYNKKVSDLSGGMKRRVHIAVALLRNPKFLVLDEPFSGVDFDNVSKIEFVLKTLSKNNISQIISGHSPEQLLPIIDSVVVLKSGKLIYRGSKDDFLSFSKNKNGTDALSSILEGEVP